MCSLSVHIKFNKELFKDHVKKGMRLNDDLIDLEMEKIDQIIAKIDADPEEQEVKEAELNLWRKIQNKTLGGRRTGLGITAEGDMLAALGLVYGTDKAIDLAVEIQ